MEYAIRNNDIDMYHKILRDIVQYNRTRIDPRERIDIDNIKDLAMSRASDKISTKELKEMQYDTFTRMMKSFGIERSKYGKKYIEQSKGY